MAIYPTKKLLNYDDYAALPDDGMRYELIDGELALCPAPTPAHQRLLRRLVLALGPYIEQAGGVRCSSRLSTSCSIPIRFCSLTSSS